MTESSDRASAERVIPAPAEKIFDLLADPTRHRDIDGSGTVRDAKSGTERLTLGSKFGMSMKMGIPYSMRYDLEPVDGGTLVRETWDISQEAGLSKPLVARGRDHTVKNMEKTLARIEELVTA